MKKARLSLTEKGAVGLFLFLTLAWWIFLAWGLWKIFSSY